jgi:hypothetical protein
MGKMKNKDPHHLSNLPAYGEDAVYAVVEFPLCLSGLIHLFSSSVSSGLTKFDVGRHSTHPKNWSYIAHFCKHLPAAHKMALKQPSRGSRWFWTITAELWCFLSFEALSAAQTALALRQAIWRKADPGWRVCGIPKILYSDNGSDFTSQHLEQVLLTVARARKVHVDGIRYQGLRYVDTTLAAYVGESVTLRTTREIWRRFVNCGTAPFRGVL